jgi:PAS domain S-box-containing protein
VAVTTPRPAHDAHPEGAVDYRTLIEQIPAITYTEVHDATGQRTTYVSPQAASILGHLPNEFVADPGLWRRLRHPADRALVMAAERTAEVTKRPFHAEYRMLDRSGRLHWFRDEAVLVDANGGTFWQGVMFDVTSEKQAEEQAAAAELRYRSLVESLPCMVYVDELNERATNVYTSSQTEALLGYTVKDWADDPDLWLSTIVHPLDRERCRQAEWRHTQELADFDETYRCLHRDGHTVWVRDVGTIVHDDDGMPLYSQGFILDISAQKEAESDLEDALEREHAQAQQLRDLDDLKTTLLHTLSYDLKEPLTAVLLSARALRRPDLAPEEARELLDGMTERARHMDRLLSDLLDLERLGRGMLDASRYPVDVGQLVTTLVQASTDLEGRTVELDANTAVAPVDAPKVERVVESLIANAVRHTPADARIWIRVTPRDGGALIAVEDEGPGVADEQKEAVFLPFHKADADTPGSGIGLSLVRRFAELHGGRAWVEDRPGGGASFLVLLPSADA